MEIPDRIVKRFNNRWKEREDGCHEWTAGKSQGYGTIGIGDKTYGAHRISVMIEEGRELETEELVCHKCHNRECVNPDHLYIGDKSDNAKDAVKNGDWNPNVAKGEDHHRAKLTAGDVREIVERYENEDISQYDLADEYNTDQTEISDIVKGKVWSSITGIEYDKQETERCGSITAKGTKCKYDKHSCPYHNGSERGLSLKREEVKEIRRRYESEDTSYSKLGKEYDVGRATIQRIINNKVYRSE